MRQTSKDKGTTAIARFRKTRIMNIFGAFGIAIMGVALLAIAMQEQPPGILTLIVAWSAVLVLVPAVTARALSRASSPSLKRAMLRANWLLIGFWSICVGIGLLLMALGRISLAATSSAVLLSALFYVLPEWVNIRALSSALASKNSALAHEAKSIEPGRPNSSA
jgi:hypothetical protein